MKNFIIIHDEKTGTSALTQQLNQFRNITAIKSEAFDRHSCGPMSLSNLQRCLDIVYSRNTKAIAQLQSIYTKTATKPLPAFDFNEALGFKMRFQPLRSYSTSDNALNAYLRKKASLFYKKVLIGLFLRHNVVVLFSIRQDLMRWALSKYHGGGTGNPGHLQFDLATGKINREDIGKIQVDCKRLENIISQCEFLHQRTRSLMQEFTQAGVRAYPILYERFLSDRSMYYQDLFRYLDIKMSNQEIDKVLSNREFFKKVHSDDISEFVINYEEVLEKFSNRYVHWN